MFSAVAYRGQFEKLEKFIHHGIVKNDEVNKKGQKGYFVSDQGTEIR